MKQFFSFLAKRPLFVAFLAVLVHLFLLVRTQFTAWPEMLLWPYLILKGWLPYKDIAIAHTPFLFTDLTIFYRIFGIGVIQLKIYSWLLILMTDGLLFWIVRKIWKTELAIVSLLAYIPLQLYYGGNGLWFDLALAPLALLIYYCLKKQKYFWAGIWWGIAFFTKQTAVWFLIPVFVMLLKSDLFKGVRNFTKGTLLISLPILAIIYLLGIFPDFLYWAIRFGVGILPTSSGQILLPSLRQFLIAIFPIAVLILVRIRLKNPSSVIILWAFFGTLGTYPRWDLFHFQPSVPFLAIGLALMLLSFPKVKVIEKSVLVIALALFLIVIGRQTERAWGQGNRFVEPQIRQASTYLKNNTSKDDKIYVFNTWDNIYALSDTLPAVRPWIPGLGWYVGLSDVQEKMAAQLAQVRPRYIVIGQYEDMNSWVYKPELILNFIRANYQVKDKIGQLSILVPKR